MKPLNHLTTPEQSQRLLDMGLPSWTADFEYNNHKIEGSDELLPCWSVGKLIEIIKNYLIIHRANIEVTELLIKTLQKLINHKAIDASKSEE